MWQCAGVSMELGRAIRLEAFDESLSQCFARALCQGGSSFNQQASSEGMRGKRGQSQAGLAQGELSYGQGPHQSVGR